MSKMPRNHKNFMSFVVIILLFPVFLLSPYLEIVNAQGVTDLEQQIEKKKKEISDKKGVLGAVEGRIEAIKSSNSSIQEKIKMMTEEIEKLKSDIETKDKEVQEKIKEIESKQGELMKVKENLDVVSGSLYVETRNKMANFIFADWKGFMQNFYIRKGAVTVLKEQIEKINGEFSSLADARSKSEKEKEELDKQKKDLDDSQKLLAEEKAKLQAELSRQNAKKNAIKAQIGGLTKEISATQQMLLYLKGGGDLLTTNIPSSKAEPTTQLAYFKANAPRGTFGVFSFGASSHRNGMSQWGAWERALNGQSYLDILGFYYQTRNVKTGTVKFPRGEDVPITEEIPVDGYGRINLEEYLLGVREIDPRFNKDTPQDMNNLKAQVIASRTYAVYNTKNGSKSICTTQSCQVYNPSNPYRGAWAKAVAETKGMTLANSSGEIFSTQFSNVTGGYINNVGFDVNTALQGSWTETAWEGLSGVDWFHKIWYQITLPNTNKKISCPTHPNPWMSGEELADILNAYKYFKSLGKSPLDPRLTAIDINTCFNKSENPYSHAELANLVQDPIAKVLRVELLNSNGWTVKLNFHVLLHNGSVTTYTINGSASSDGDTAVFRDVFNMRAPGYLSIPQKCKGCLGHIHINIVQN